MSILLKTKGLIERERERERERETCHDSMFGKMNMCHHCVHPSI